MRVGDRVRLREGVPWGGYTGMPALYIQTAEIFSGDARKPVDSALGIA